MRPRQESNPDQRLRTALLYPLSYGGEYFNYIGFFLAWQFYKWYNWKYVGQYIPRKTNNKSR